MKQEERCAGSRIGLIGPLPPPYGGVSVHIRRLGQRLAASGHCVTIYCQPTAESVDGCRVRPAAGRLSWRRWLLRYGWRDCSRVLHCHDGWHWSPALLLHALLGKRIVMTFHDQQTLLKFQEASRASRFAACLLFRLGRARYVAVSDRVAEQLVEIGAPRAHVVVQPAFIPPVLENRMPRDLPPFVSGFCTAHDPMLVTYGWRLATDSMGRDLYGFDLSLRALAAVREYHPETGLVLLIPLMDDDSQMRRLVDLALELDIAEAVLFVNSPIRHVGVLWSACDIVLRPSTSDGDAVSVREALYVGTRVVASDAATRPEGVAVHQTGSLVSLVAVLRRVLADRRSVGHSAAEGEMVDPIDLLLESYGV